MLLGGCGGGGGGTTPPNGSDTTPPTFTSASSFSVAENQTSGFTAIATDSSAITYSISGTDAGSFTINPTSGVVTFKVVPDYETKTSYTLTVTATDSSNNTSTQNVTVNITDVNEIIPDTSIPVFTSASTFSVAENQTSGFTATATDSSAITYSISGTDAGSFTINPTSGVVTFKVAPDYETKTSYSLIVTATDSSNNTSTQNVTVNITDVNEIIPDTTPPTFTSNTSFNVAENQTSGFTAIATDSSAITYSISGTDANSFTINPTSGVVTFKVAPDYEAIPTKTSYTLTVTATDVANNYSTQNVTVNITDVDESSSGYLIDSAVEGVDYICGNLTGVTNSDGRFTYETSKCPAGVEFKLGSLSLGSINPSAINTDTYLTIQELAGTTRDNVTDGNVTKLAVLLQSLDDNNNSNDGILITQNIKNLFTVDENLSSKTDSEVTSLITTTASKTEKDIHTVLSHLLDFTKSKDSSVTTVITPQDFNLTSVTGTALNTQTSSNTITIRGLTIPTYITISNGSEYSVNGGTYKSTKSLVRNDDNVTVRHTTANSLSGATTTTLKIGGVTKTFGSTTRTTPPPPSKSLLRTGQTNCYKADNSVVACSDDDVSVLRDDGYYTWKGRGIARTFTRNNDTNITTDTKTELQWEDGTTPSSMTWANANTILHRLRLWWLYRLETSKYRRTYYHHK